MSLFRDMLGEIDFHVTFLGAMCYGGWCILIPSKRLTMVESKIFLVLLGVFTLVLECMALTRAFDRKKERLASILGNQLQIAVMLGIVWVIWNAKSR